MRVKIVWPIKDGVASISFQEIEAPPSVGDVLIFENGNGALLHKVISSPNDPDGCAYTCGGAPVTLHRGRDI